MVDVLVDHHSRKMAVDGLFHKNFTFIMLKKNRRVIELRELHCNEEIHKSGVPDSNMFGKGADSE